MKVDTLAGNLVVGLHQSFKAARVVVFRDRRCEDVLQDRGRDNIVRNGGRFARPIQSCCYALQRSRAIDVVLHVLFTRPDDFDWLADGSGKQEQPAAQNPPATQPADLIAVQSAQNQANLPFALVSHCQETLGPQEDDRSHCLACTAS